MNIFNSGHKKHLYDPPPNVYTKDTCKTIAPPVSQKDGLALTYLS